MVVPSFVKSPPTMTPVQACIGKIEGRANKPAITKDPNLRNFFFIFSSYYQYIEIH